MTARRAKAIILAAVFAINLAAALAVLQHNQHRADQQAAATARACGAFAAINNLAHESLQAPGTGPSPAFDRTYDLVGLANSLNVTEKPSISPELANAIADYVGALAEQGAAINSHDHIAPAALRAAEHTVITRCGPIAASSLGDRYPFPASARNPELPGGPAR